METSGEFSSFRPIEAGFLLRDRYEIRSLLGEGGFARTYIALDRKENRKCVVKALSLRHVDTFKAKELFDREAKVLANLDHPHIPKFIDFFTDDSTDGSQIYLVQEFKEGSNVSKLVEQGKHFTEKEVIQIAIRIAEILEYLQGFSPPIIHRDIKPSNILLSGPNQPELIDFGAVRDKVLNDPILRSDGPTIIGTYGYMPLEQFEGRAVPASDIYSLGVTLLYMLSQKEPWDMEKEGIRLDFQPHVRISAAFTEVLSKMIDPDPSGRYASASDLKDALQTLLKPKTKEKSTARVVPKFSRTKKVIYPAIILAFFLFIVVLYQYANRSKPVIVNGTAPSPVVTTPNAEPKQEIPLFLAPRDVTGFIRVQNLEQFTTFTFIEDLANTQILDIAAADDQNLWIASSKGVMRFDIAASRWRLFGINADIPAERVDSIAASPTWVAADLSHETRPGYTLSSGTYVLDPEQERWRKVSGSAWDLYRDGNILWVGTDHGLEAHDLNTEDVKEFKKENSGLIHNEVHSIRRIGDVVWVGSLGDYVTATKDFAGGGVSRLDLTTRTWTSFTKKQGLARDYSCSIAGDEKEVWVAHWGEEYGLSRYDPERKQWNGVRVSANGIPLGGVALAIEPDYLWIGQQGGLIRLHRVSRHAVRWTETDGLPGYIISGISLTKDAVWATVYAYDQQGVRLSGVVRIPRYGPVP